ncbi:MAG TPA: glycosyltransferase 87 family protein [Acidimicrobiales bacterium]|nr:glycosyltransferase 87 family protein [Acidimicrobiales bacterium]
MGTLDAGLLPHRYCYADVANLFVPRGLGRHIFPYVHGVMATSGTGNVFIGHGEIEYPVLTGIFVWLSALPVSTPGAFQVSTCLMLTPFGVLGAWSLWRMTGTRALYFVLTPAFVTYAFLNWDLIGLGLAMAALYMWQRDRPNWAAVLLALGTCAKLWPGLLLLPLITEYALINRRRAIHIAAIATATAALVNAPFILINPRGWYIPFEFQSRRGVSIDTNSLWYWDAHWLPTASVNALSTFAVAVGLLALLTWSVRCYHRSGTYPFLHVSAASVAWYLLAWKVYSPQYDLWLLPFFALVVYKRRIWISFVLADLLLYIWWLLAPPTTLDWLLALVVFWRAATVIWFIRASLTSTFSREHSEAYSSTGLIAHLLSR